MLSEPVELKGREVHLVPLSFAHAPALLREAKDARIWQWWSRPPPTEEPLLRGMIEAQLAEQAQGTALPFSILCLSEGNRPVGMTRFMEIRREHHRAEIGGTWLPSRLWGTKVNLEAKYLLLRYAFEKEGLERVELKTDVRNLRSQKAMEKIGATREGVLAHHMCLPDGSFRDSVYYRILSGEWPGVRTRLEGRLEELGREPPYKRSA
jgi:RimJ/RimL family protein N-acetyltransferase